MAIAGLLLLMVRLAAPAADSALATPAVVSAGATPTHSPGALPAGQVPDEPVVATVDGTPVTESAWQTAARLDAVLSRLAAQPIPVSQETLDRLVDEILLLRETGLEDATVTPAEVEARIASLESGWGLADAEVVSALEAAGLTRQSLVKRVARLILVERAIEILSARHLDLDTWLAQARQSTEISLYQPLGVPPQQIQDIPSPPTEFSPVETPVPPEVATLDRNLAPLLAVDSLPVDETSVAEAGNSPGEPAPDFTLDSAQGVAVTLSDYQGKSNVVLVFYRGKT
jgi:hypothetical protein